MGDGGATLEGLIAQLPTGMMLVDAAGHITQINRAAAEILGATRAGAVGRPLAALHARLAPLGTPARRAEVRITREGEPVIVGYTATGLPGGGGVVVTLSDITDERARAVAEEHERRLADLGRVVATVAHEIRNPLFAISSLVQVLAGEDAVAADPDLGEICDKAMQEVRRIARLVEDLTTLGRPAPSVPRPVDLLVELGAVGDDLTRALTPLPGGLRPRIEIETARDLAEGAPPNVDPDALRSLTGCLIRNAWRSIAEHPRPDAARCRVRVFVSRRDDRLELEVHDRGAPIDPEMLPRVFEPFFRRGAYGGGLALTIVDQRVRRLGGSVSVHSTAEAGTRFRVSLPRAWG